ncbi:MAG: thioredoxin family protein [Lachnospiraceae bacterium]|nr:thioredoxin family protein [Lachnospiraceae bacterium]
MRESDCERCGRTCTDFKEDHRRTYRRSGTIDYTGRRPGKECIMAVISVNEQNFEEVVNGGKTVLLDLYADWCMPCRKMAPLVERLSEEHPELTVGKVNVEDEPEIAGRFNVMSIPMLVVLKDGKIAAKNVGTMPYDLIEKMATEV